MLLQLFRSMCLMLEYILHGVLQHQATGEQVSSFRCTYILVEVQKHRFASEKTGR